MDRGPDAEKQKEKMKKKKKKKNAILCLFILGYSIIPYIRKPFGISIVEYCEKLSN
jgi:hypothetical protein